MLNLLTIIILYFNILYYRVITFFKNPQPTYQVILKADDLRDYSEKVKKLDKIIQEENIKISWGIIGNSLENPSDEYVQFLKNKSNDEHYHFFNHGYTHICAVKGQTDEFGQAYNIQFDYLKKTQDLLKNKTSIILDTFGALCNSINADTAKALDNISEIKYWYFGTKNTSKFNLLRPQDKIRGEYIFEHKAGDVDFYFLRKNWKDNVINKNGVIILQIHPYMWHTKQFMHFKAAIAFLKSKGVEFVVPTVLKKENKVEK